MNETIEVEIADAEDQTALAVIRTALPTILAADQNDILAKLAAELKSFARDGSTEKGRAEIGSKKRKAGSARQDMIRLADALKEDAQKTIKGVNAEVKVINERFDALITWIEAPRVAYEEHQKARIEGHELALAAIAALTAGVRDMSSDAILGRLVQLEEIDRSGRAWEEFTTRAISDIAATGTFLRHALDDATDREAEAAELARLRAEQTERDRLAAIEANAKRDAEIAAAAADAARHEAEAKAARDAAAAAAALADVQRKADRDAEVARQVAERAETARVAAHEDAISDMRKLAKPLAAPDPAVVIDAKLSQLDDIYAKRNWEEFKAQADMAYIEHQATLQDARVESVRLAEEADRRKRADADAAEAKRQAAAIETDRARVAEEKRAEDAAAAKRAENVAHRRGINQAIVKALMAAGLSEEDAVVVVTVVAKGLVPHMAIGY